MRSHLPRVRGEGIPTRRTVRADALNIALCRGAGAVLLTFDEKMADAARRLNVPVMPG